MTTLITNGNQSGNEATSVFMFFSERCSKQFGCKKAMVRDKQGKEKEILYTAVSADKESSECKWPDKKLVWTGKNTDYRFIGMEKPTHIHVGYNAL